MSYPNITARNMSKGFSEILYYANEVTDSWISNMILIGIWVIAAISLYNYRKDFVEAMAIAGFLTMIVSYLFWIGDFISGITLVFVIGVAIIGAVLLFFTKRR